MITRRTFLKTMGGLVAGGLMGGGYAFGVEPFRLRVQRYTPQIRDWPNGLQIRIAVLADLHACKPWMTVGRIRHIVEETQALTPDLILLLGDYGAGTRWVTDWVHSSEWSEALSTLSAPLGVHAVLGNHDWWEDRTAQKRGHGPTFGQIALERVGIPVLENRVTRLETKAGAFWIAGLGDQIALLPGRGWGRTRWQGMDDLPGTLSQVTDAAPVILMAHEPDIFPKVPDRVALTLSGHTHGGQVRIMGRSPVVPSRYRNRYAYGHVTEPGIEDPSVERHLIVSGGLGLSILPVRFGVPPEIVLVELGV